MNNQKISKNDFQNTPHPENYWKDEWVLSRKSIHGAGLIIDRHLKSAEAMNAGKTNHHLMAYVLNDFSSRQVIHLDGKKYDGGDKRGNIWLKPANISGFWHWENKNEALIFAIKPAFLRQIALKSGCLNHDCIEVLSVVQTHNPELDFLAMQFKRELDREEFGNQMFLESLANQFAIHLLRNYCVFPATLKEDEGGLSPYKLKQAIEYINDNLDSLIKLNELAELIDLSQSYFCHMFKLSMGIAPYKYVTKQRVARVKQLLEQGKLPLVEISLECGFNSQSQMTKHFRQCVGVTPKVYRNNK